MVMAPRAPERQPEKHRAGRLHAVDDILNGILLRHNAVFRVAPVIPVEARRQPLLEGRIRQHIPGQLFQHEPVKRLVPIEAVDDVIPPPPHHPLPVVLIAVGIGIARRIEPPRGHPLAKTRRSQQPVHQLLVSLRRGIPQKGIQLPRRRRQTGQVERHAARLRLPARRRPHRQALFAQARRDEMIDTRRTRRRLRWHKTPMRLPLGALPHPRGQRLLLSRRQRQPRVGRRHLLALLLARNTGHEFAGRNRRARLLLHVEPQRNAFGLGVRPVAVVALIRQNRADIAIKLQFRLGGQNYRGNKNGQQNAHNPTPFYENNARRVALPP